MIRYWSRYPKCCNFTFQVTPIVCLLGALKESLTLQGHAVVLRLFYLARKLIAHYWISLQVPTKRQWVEQVNNMLICKKLTYQHRNVPKNVMQCNSYGWIHQAFHHVNW